MQLPLGIYLSNILLVCRLLTSLRNILIHFIVPTPKSIFGIHDPVGFQYIFQLRVSLSPLRGHKWRHNFVDTPSEMCLCNGGIEDTIHFLFSCPLYAIQRVILKLSVVNILQKNNQNHSGNQTQVYLYGHRSINPSDNKLILLATIKYIKDTQRFST